MKFSQPYHPEIDEEARAYLESIRTSWDIRAQHSTTEFGEIYDENGKHAFSFKLSADHPTIELISATSTSFSSIWREQAKSVGTLITLLELGFWQEGRVVVLKQNRTLDQEDVLDAYGKTREEISQIYSELMPFEEEYFDTIDYETFLFAAPVSRTRFVLDLLGSELHDLAIELLSREWTIKENVMHHITGMEVQMPSYVPGDRWYNYGLHRCARPIKQNAKKLEIGVVRFSVDRESVLDQDFPSCEVKIFDYPRHRGVCNDFWDWLALPGLVRGWVVYYDYYLNYILNRSDER